MSFPHGETSLLGDIYTDIFLSFFFFCGVDGVGIFAQEPRRKIQFNFHNAIDKCQQTESSRLAVACLYKYRIVLFRLFHFMICAVHYWVLNCQIMSGKRHCVLLPPHLPAALNSVFLAFQFKTCQAPPEVQLQWEVTVARIGSCVLIGIHMSCE